MNAVSLLEMARGAIMEQTDVEVVKVLDNILDPNTPAEKKRQIVLTLEFTPSADRQTVTVTANAKSKLLPNNSIKTALYVGADKNGELVAAEMVANPGQFSLTGEAPEEQKVLKMSDLKKAAGGNE